MSQSNEREYQDRNGESIGEETRQPTKLSQYKSEVRFLKGQIRRAAATLRMREKAKALRVKLDRLQDNIERGFDPNVEND